jgi:hypothetical protein
MPPAGVEQAEFTRLTAVGAADTPIGAIKQYSQATATTQKRESMAIYGGQTSLVQIAYQATAISKFYPYGGANAGAAGSGLGSQASGAANGNTLLALPADILDGVLSQTNFKGNGLLVAVLCGGTKLVVRSLKTFTGSGPFIFTVDRLWATAEGVPAANDKFWLGVDLQMMRGFHIQADSSNSSGNPQVIPVLYDWGVVGPAAAQGSRKPFPIADARRTLVNSAVTLEPPDTGTRYALASLTLDSRGAMFGAVYLVSLDGTTNISIFAGAS